MLTIRRQMARFFALFNSRSQAQSNQQSRMNARSATPSGSDELNRERLVERARQFKKENERTFRRLARE